MIGTGVFLGNRTVLTRTRYGHKIFVDADDIVLSPHIILDGDWESWITEYFKRTLRSGQTFVDVGANCGWYTLIGAMSVGNTGKVIAFDPNPHCASLLRKTVSINGCGSFVRVVEAACGAEEGTVEFRVPKTGSGNGFVTPIAGDTYDSKRRTITVSGGNVQIGDGNRMSVRHHPQVPPDDVPDTVSLARLVRLDSEVEYADVIKIDAEGFEPDVMRGASKLLEKNPRLEIVAEHHATNVPYFAELAAMGWDMHVIQHDSNTRRILASELDQLADSEMISFTRKP